MLFFPSQTDSEGFGRLEIVRIGSVRMAAGCTNIFSSTCLDEDGVAEAGAQSIIRQRDVFFMLLLVCNHCLLRCIDD